MAVLRAFRFRGWNLCPEAVPGLLGSDDTESEEDGLDYHVGYAPSGNLEGSLLRGRAPHWFDDALMAQTEDDVRTAGQKIAKTALQMGRE
jgi:hypothetical protein